MIPERYRILMNNTIDGTCTPAETDQLDAYFTSHPEAAKYLEDLKKSLGSISNVNEEEPPANLHGRIMRAVAKKKRMEKVSWQEIVFGRLRLGYALSAIVGIMVGFFVHTMIPMDSLSSVNTPIKFFRGTNTTELESHWTPAIPLEWTLDGTSGSIHAYQLDGKVLVRLALQTDLETTVIFRFNDSSSLDGVNFTTNDGFTTTLSGDFFNIKGSGICHCDFMLEGLADPELVVKLEHGKVTQLQQSIIWLQI